MADRGVSARPQPTGAEASAAAGPSTSAATVTNSRDDSDPVLGICFRCGSGDKLKFCSRCQLVRYCGPDCQKADVSGRGR